MNIKSIEDIDIADKTVFIRTDYDCGAEAHEKLLEHQIDYSLATIEYALSQGSRVVIASHRSVKQHKYDEQYSLSKAGDLLSEKLGTNIYFPDNCIGDAVKKLKHDMRCGDIILLENLMFHKYEAENDTVFAKKLSEDIDVYVNEAFGLINYGYASNLGMLEYVDEKCAGLSFYDEIQSLNNLLANPQSPFVVYFGSEEIYPKIELLESMIDKVDILLLSGVFANTLLKAIGFDVSEKYYDKSSVYRIKKLYDSIIARKKRVIVSDDFMIYQKSDNSEYTGTVERSKLKEDFHITGMGKNSQDLYCNILKDANTVLWDGFTGYENSDMDDNLKSRLYAALNESSGNVVVIKEYNNSGYQAETGEHLHVSYNCNAAYAYLKNQHIEALDALRS